MLPQEVSDIIITEELDGLTVRLPAATRNLLLG